MLFRCLALTLLTLTTPLCLADAAPVIAVCVACHGQHAEGNPALQAPALAGQSSSYIARQLMHFKSGLRGGEGSDQYSQQMRGMAATLADEAAIQVVSEHLASLPRTTPAATISGDADAGYKQYNMKCGACHSAKAEGNEALNAPMLSHVGDAYLARQFEQFRSGSRGTAKDDKYGRQMRMMATTVSDSEFIDILAYLNTLQ